METATKADLAELEDRLNTRLDKMDARQDATEVRLDKMDARLDKMDARLDDLKQGQEMLRSEMQHFSDDLKEVMRDNQTELLKAFYSYATTTDLKLNDAAASDANLRERLSAVERRVTELERKSLLPNQPDA